MTEKGTTATFIILLVIWANVAILNTVEKNRFYAMQAIQEKALSMLVEIDERLKADPTGSLQTSINQLSRELAVCRSRDGLTALLSHQPKEVVDEAIKGITVTVLSDPSSIWDISQPGETKNLVVQVGRKSWTIVGTINAQGGLTIQIHASGS